VWFQMAPPRAGPAEKTVTPLTTLPVKVEPVTESEASASPGSRGRISAPITPPSADEVVGAPPASLPEHQLSAMLTLAIRPPAVLPSLGADESGVRHGERGKGCRRGRLGNCVSASARVRRVAGEARSFRFQVAVARPDRAAESRPVRIEFAVSDGKASRFFGE